MSIQDNYLEFKKDIPENVQLVVVSKTRSAEQIQEVYNAGQRAFGENRVQELLDKKDELPQDIQWHLIGHLQTNKVKQILPFVHLIHSVDSEKLMQKIQLIGENLGLKTSILLQVKIADEDSKFGLSHSDLLQILNDYRDGLYPNIQVRGLMGMATFTESEEQLYEEFDSLTVLFDRLQFEFKLDTLSMGMSNDYQIAIECGSNMIRVGSAIFGKRN